MHDTHEPGNDLERMLLHLEAMEAQNQALIDSHTRQSLVFSELTSKRPGKQNALGPSQSLVPQVPESTVSEL